MSLNMDLPGVLLIVRRELCVPGGKATWGGAFPIPSCPGYSSTQLRAAAVNPHQVGQVSVGQDSPLDGYFATSFHSTLFGSESLSAAHTSGVGSYVLSLGAGE